MNSCDSEIRNFGNTSSSRRVDDEPMMATTKGDDKGKPPRNKIRKLAQKCGTLYTITSYFFSDL